MKIGEVIYTPRHEGSADSNLPKGEWKDAWYGKMDGYFKAIHAAGENVDVVSLRGSAVCHWERLTLDGHRPVERGNVPDILLGSSDRPKDQYLSGWNSQSARDFDGLSDVRR